MSQSSQSSQSFLLLLPLTAAMLFASYSMPALAQGSAVAAGNRADPADAAARVPPLAHQSSFADYQGFSEQEVKDWRERNDNVGRIGGWRAYAEESRPTKPAAKPPVVPAVPAAAAKAAPPTAPPAMASKPASAPPAKSDDASDAHKQHH